MKSLDTTDVVTFNNLTAKTTTLPKMTMGSKFKKKISEQKQINDDKKSIDLINSSTNTSTTPSNETKFLKFSNIYIHDNSTNDNNNNNSNNNIYSVENLDKPIKMTTIITPVNNINNDDNNNKTPPSIANLNSIEKVSNPSTIKTFETNFSRARALDIPSSPPEPTNSLNANLTDLSDVSMDEEDKQVEGGEYIAAHHNESHIKILPIIFTNEPKCIEPNNKTYLVGETIVRGCTEKCICGYNGTAENCQPICKSPLVRAIGKSKDPFCHKQQIDNNDCCAILICSSVNYDHKLIESTETCNFIGNDNENKTITIGEHIEDGCSRICTCQVGGVLNCKPRCPLVADDDNNDNNNDNNNNNNNNAEKSHEANLKKNNYDRCVKLKDPRDPCCTITYCDVSIGEHDELISSIDDNTEATTTKTINGFNDGILNDTNLLNDQVKVLNSTAIRILLSQELLNNNKTIIEISKNNHTWKQQIFNKEGIISNLEPSSIYYIRIKTDGKNNNNNDNKTISTVDSIITLPATEIKINIKKSDNGTTIKINNDDTCSYRGNLYKIGTEWYDECIYFCVCEKGAKTECVTIECPTDFGLDVLDPHCIDWETVPLNFVPKAPQCCPEEVRCRNNGSCIYQSIMYDNWSEIPNNITGCDKRCYCEMGKVSCQPACPPIPALPPDTLSCVSNQAILTKLPDDECCLHWTCGNENNNNYHTSISDDTMSSAGLLTTTDIVSNDMKKNSQSSVIANDNNGNKKLNNKTTISISKLTLAKEIENSKDNDDYGAGIDVKLLHKNYTKLSSTHSQHHAPNNSDTINYFTSNEYSIARPTEIKIPIYNGPYNPDYKLPELGNFDNNLQLSNNNDNINKNNHGQSEKMISPLIIKDRFLKSKLSDIKKKNESANQAYYHNKATKEEQQQKQQVMSIQTFPGPLAPDRFPTLPSLLPTIIVTSMPEPSSGHIYPSFGFPIHSDVTAATEYLGQVSEQSSLNNNNDNNDDEIIIKSLDAIDDSTIRILFTVPAVLVGLYGRVELRYTKEKINLDPSKWKSQVFIPPNDLIATPQLEFELDGLEPSTEYKLKVTVNLGNGQAFKNNPTSKIYSIKTLERYKDRQQILTTITTTTTDVSLPPQIFIDAGLKVTEKNFSWIKVEWKKFTEYEIQFIDGIQLRYKEYDSKVYTTTPLIHRAVTSWVIEDLKPATTYQIGISIIPFPGQTTELYSEKTIQITTAIELDPYSFDVKVEIKTVKSQEVELSWSGVPYPEDKYVNIYRAIYQSDSGKGDTSTFKIAKRDSPAKTIISDLKPGTRYRLWLEIYLTNGKIKKSNVQDFITKPGVDLLHTASSDNIYHQPNKFNIVATAAAASIPSLQLDGSNKNNNNYDNNNYYGPLVIVAIVASLSILSTLILLMMLMKRRSSNKADISSSRKTTTSAAYDNPSYKVEIQQETMDL